MVRHLTKRGGRHALYRGGGSIGITAAVRSVLLVGKPPEEPNLRVLCQSKLNLALEATSLLFEPVPGSDGVVQIEWRGECDYSPDDLLAGSKPDFSRLAEATAFLTNLLADGPSRSNGRSKPRRSRLVWPTEQSSHAKEVLGVGVRTAGVGGRGASATGGCRPEGSRGRGRGAHSTPSACPWRSIDARVHRGGHRLKCAKICRGKREELCQESKRGNTHAQLHRTSCGAEGRGLHAGWQGRGFSIPPSGVPNAIQFEILGEYAGQSPRWVDMLVDAEKCRINPEICEPPWVIG